MPSQLQSDPVEVFLSYSHKDEVFREELGKHLSILKRQDVISEWHDRKITAGSEWAGEIDDHLDTAQIILLLISANFLASDYCYDIELKRAMERHEAGEARVIPVILRPVDWHNAAFGKLHALPRDGKPITTWSNRDQAFENVARGIREVIKAFKVQSKVPLGDQKQNQGEVQAISTDSINSSEKIKIEHSSISETESNSLLQTLSKIDELPPKVLETYSRLWQLEIWLRRMVYVELKSNYGDMWRTKVRSQSSERSFQSDKRLTHMTTPEVDLVSYLTFGELCATILEEWPLFEMYFPPKELWKAKVEEIKQIRNRLAHFRVGHRDDLQRVLQFLRDIDQGFWRFCTSFNHSFPIMSVSTDPILEHILSETTFGYAYSVASDWAGVRVSDRRVIFNLMMSTNRRPWKDAITSSNKVGVPGYMYDVVLWARDDREFDYTKLLDDISVFQEQFIYICLHSSEKLVRVTIPAVLGPETVTNIVEGLIEKSLYSVQGRRI